MITETDKTALIRELTQKFGRLTHQDITDAVNECLENNDSIDLVRTCATNKLRELLRKLKRKP